MNFPFFLSTLFFLFFDSSGGGKVEKCLSRSFARRVTFLASREEEFDGFFFFFFLFLADKIFHNRDGIIFEESRYDLANVNSTRDGAKNE